MIMDLDMKVNAIPQNIGVAITQLQKDMDSIKLSILVQTCSDLGIQDGNLRKYTEEECDSMDGIYKSDGSCGKKDGGSYSSECGNLLNDMPRTEMATKTRVKEVVPVNYNGPRKPVEPPMPPKGELPRGSIGGPDPLTGMIPGEAWLTREKTIERNRQVVPNIHNNGPRKPVEPPMPPKGELPRQPPGAYAGPGLPILPSGELPRQPPGAYAGPGLPILPSGELPKQPLNKGTGTATNTKQPLNKGTGTATNTKKPLNTGTGTATNKKSTFVGELPPQWKIDPVTGRPVGPPGWKLDSNGLPVGVLPGFQLGPDGVPRFTIPLPPGWSIDPLTSRPVGDPTGWQVNLHDGLPVGPLPGWTIGPDGRPFQQPKIPSLPGFPPGLPPGFPPEFARLFGFRGGRKGSRQSRRKRGKRAVSKRRK